MTNSEIINLTLQVASEFTKKTIQGNLRKQILEEVSRRIENANKAPQTPPSDMAFGKPSRTQSLGTTPVFSNREDERNIDDDD